MNPHGRGRHTTQKDEVLRALRSAAGFVSAQELHGRLVREGSGVGLSTVYRQLADLASAGDADVLPVASGRVYRACSSATHDHLVCTRCGTAVEVPPPPRDRVISVAREHGYVLGPERLELVGLCLGCAPRDPDTLR